MEHLRIALPVSVNMLAYRAPWITSIAFVGRLGATPLAAASMASTLGNVTGISLLVGLSSALGTLGAQAFGAGAYDAVGIALQRCLLVFLGTCTAVSTFWLAGVEPFLVATGQDHEVARLAGEYMRLLTPGLWGAAVNFGLQKYLQVQGLTRPPAAASVVTAVLHVPLNYLFIYSAGLGWRGAAVATSVNQIITPLLLLCIMNCSDLGCCSLVGSRCVNTLLLPNASDASHLSSQSPEAQKAGESIDLGRKSGAGGGASGGGAAGGAAAAFRASDVYLKCWPGWRREAFQLAPMLEFCRLAAGGLVMIMEWWASEIAILMAGVADGAVGLATLAVYQTTLSTIFMFSVGYQVSAATRVGQCLGRGLPMSARRAAAVAPTLVGLVTSCLALLLFVFRVPVPRLFVGAGEKTLARHVTRTYRFLCLYVIGDGISTAFGGVIQGVGKQNTAGIVVLLAYFGVALPVAYTLAIRNGFGYMGCVGAMTLGTFLQCAGNGTIVAAVKWPQEAQKARARALGASSEDSSSSSSGASYTTILDETGDLDDTESPFDSSVWVVGSSSSSEEEDSDEGNGHRERTMPAGVIKWTGVSSRDLSDEKGDFGLHEEASL
jgi:Na+-driven multidrug efflux pump